MVHSSFQIDSLADEVDNNQVKNDVSENEITECSLGRDALENIGVLFVNLNTIGSLNLTKISLKKKSIKLIIRNF